MGSWVLKLLDVYEGTHKAFGGAFPLNRLLQANGMESKTGTGGEAIELARAGRWEELGEYCMQVEWAFFLRDPPRADRLQQDTVKTYEVSLLRPCVLPLRTRQAVRLGAGGWSF